MTLATAPTQPQRSRFTFHVSRFTLVLITALSLTVRLIGLGWGIPEYDPALLLNSPYRHSYHLDEDNFLWGLALMHDRGDFDLYSYQWGTLQFFLVDGALLLGSAVGAAPSTWHEAFLAGEADALPGLYMLGRLVSVLAGVGATLLVVALGTALAGRGAGLFAGAAYALAPLAVVGAHYLTNDVTMSAFVAGSVLAAVLALRRGNWRWLLLSGLLLGLATSTKYSAVFAAPALLVAQTLTLRRAEQVEASERQSLGRVAAIITLPWLLAALGFVVGTPYAIFAPDKIAEGLRQASEGNALDFSQGIGAPIGMLLSQGRALTIFGLTLPLAVLALGGTVALVLAVARKVFRGRGFGLFSLPIRAEWAGAAVVLAALAGLTVGLALNRVPMLRYTQPVLPLLAACAGVMLASMPRIPIRIGAGALVLLVALWITLGQLSLLTGRHTADDLHEWIRANVPPGREIARLWPEYPVLDESRYRLTRLDPWRPDLPPGASPDYIILDDMQLGPAAASVTNLLPSYREVARFAHRPSVLGHTWDEGRTPHDWKYSHPTFTVYARR